jgi:hypothetical protein
MEDIQSLLYAAKGKPEIVTHANLSKALYEHFHGLSSSKNSPQSNSSDLKAVIIESYKLLKLLEMLPII